MEAERTHFGPFMGLIYPQKTKDTAKNKKNAEGMGIGLSPPPPPPPRNSKLLKHLEILEKKHFCGRSEGPQKFSQAIVSASTHSYCMIWTF